METVTHSLAMGGERADAEHIRTLPTARRYARQARISCCAGSHRMATSAQTSARHPRNRARNLKAPK